jgi:hypothetical protein
MLFSGRDKRDKQQPTISTKAAVEIETVLGPNTSAQGDIRSSGGVRIDGDFGGTIDIAGNLVIGEQAKVVATFVLDDGGFYRGQSKMQGDMEPPLLEASHQEEDNVVDIEATVTDQ